MGCNSSCLNASDTKKELAFEAFDTNPILPSPPVQVPLHQQHDLHVQQSIDEDGGLRTPPRASPTSTTTTTNNMIGSFLQSTTSFLSNSMPFVQNCLNQQQQKEQKPDIIIDHSSNTHPLGLTKDSPALAQYYMNAGTVLMNKGDIDGAMEYQNKARVIQEKLDKDRPDLAASYSKIGMKLLIKGDLEVQNQQQEKQHQKPTSSKSLPFVQNRQQQKSSSTLSTHIMNDDSSDAHSLAIQENVRNKDSLASVASYENLGMMLKDQGDLDGAIEHFMKALAIEEKVLNMDSPDLAVSYDNIGLLLWNKSDLDGAIEHFMKALAIHENDLNTDSPSLATCYSNVGMVLMNKGDLNGAMEYLEKALAIKEKVLDHDSPDLATTYFNIASILCKKDEFERSLEYVAMAVAIAESQFGPHHAKTLEYKSSQEFIRQALQSKSEIDLVTTYKEIGEQASTWGDIDGSLEYYKKALMIEETFIDEESLESLDLAATYGQIVGLWYEKGDIDETIKYHTKLVSTVEKVVDKHNLLDSRRSLASIYTCHASYLKEKGDVDGAIDFYKKSMKIEEQVLEKDSSELGTTYYQIAMCLHQKGMIDAAIEYHKKALNIVEVHDKSSSDLADRYAAIAEMMFAQKDWDGALNYYNRALAIYNEAPEASLYTTSLSLVVTYHKIGVLLRHKGDLETALEHLEKAFILAKERLEDGNTQLLNSLMEMAFVLREKGDMKGSVECCKKSLSILERTPERDGFRSARLKARMYNHIGSLLRNMNEFESCREYMEKAVAVAEAKLGPDHVDTIRYKSNMQWFESKFGVKSVVDKIIMLRRS